MLKDLKNTIKQSAFYGISRIAAKTISFVLIPLYTAKFSSEAVANINLLESVWQYLFIICMFSFETTIVFFCASEKNLTRRKSLLFNFFTLLVINSVMILLIGIFCAGSLSEFILQGSVYKNVIFYCFLISVFESLLIMPMTIARLNDRPSLYLIITVSNLVINLLLQIYFIVVLNYGFEFVFLSKFIAPLIMFFVFIPYVLKNVNFNIDTAEIKQILKFSFPFMIATLLSLLLNTVDRFILAEFVSKQDVAIYTVGYSIGSVTNAFILSPFTLALNVIFWKKINEDNFRRFMTKTSTYLFFTMISASLIVTFFISYAIKIFVRNEALWPAENIIPFILFSNCFVALFLFPSHDFYYTKKTNVILYIMAICLLFNFVMNLIFIQYFGIYASAVITIFSYLLMLMLGYLYTKDYSFTKFEYKKIALLSVLFVLFSAIVFTINIQNLYLDIIIKILLIFSFILILYILKFFEPVEIERIKGFFNKYFIKIIK